ncbi:MAG: serine hydrolase [Bacteroidetes bacterium]|nr:serine hydrolase [Bacteroidota bacterium]
MKNVILFFVCICLLTTCNQHPKEVADKNVLTKKIDNFLGESVTLLNIPGLSIAVTRNDSIIYQSAFGYRNLDTKEPMKVTYDFHWASVSKTFVATAMIQLVEQGKINLDEKLIHYLPYFKQKKGDYQDITIRQMLNHTSGIGDVDDYEWDKPQNDDAAPERFVKSLENDEMLFSAGKDWSYSNNAFEILGVVITKVSGVPFETYVKENILHPLEMEHTSFFYSEIPDSLRVKGHIWKGKPIVSDVYPYNRIHAPSSTLNSSVLEMTHYGIANLNRGKYKGKQILAESSYNLLWTNSVHVADTTQPKVGVSWFLENYNGLQTVSHSGGDTGFNSFFLLVPEKNISVAVVSNFEQSRTDEFAYAVLDCVLGKDPKVITRPIGYAFAEVLIKEGIEKAKQFYYQTKADSSQRKHFNWNDDEGAMIYPGRLLLNQGMHNEALDVFKFVIELNPSMGRAYGFLGVTYAKLGNKELAVQNLRHAIKVLPRSGFYYYFKEELRKVDNK